jgi:hypothetical protein
MSIPDSALNRLFDLVAEREGAEEPVDDYESFENELREVFAAAESEVLARELSRFDLDIPMVLIDGKAYRQVLREEKTYMSAAGPVAVERSLYRSRNDEKSLCPMELRAGVVEKFWTPRAAKLGLWTIAHMTPKEAEELFARLGGMAPSQSSLDRLPKQVGQNWEDNRLQFEEVLRSSESVPTGAVLMAASLDGVRLPMKDGGRAATRARQEAEGKQTKGPAGYRDASCATVSFYDQEGKRLLTRRFGRMPESKKVTLKQMLTDEVLAALEQRPDLRLVKVADGAQDNWTYLLSSLPEGPAVLDFYHATEHLNAALVAAYGETNPKRRSQYDKLRAVLLEDRRGAEKVIRSLVYLRNRFPRRKKIAQELGFFRRNRHKMYYANFRALNLPIGSGVTEASCKTLVTQRMKRSGMSWASDGGGQSILTFRSHAQSDRFDRAWHLVAATYRREVTLPDNVIPLRAR